jgi:non-ribosomal peptide synthetase component F
VRPFAKIRKGRTAFIDTVSGFKLLLVLTQAPLARLGYERTVAGMLIMAGGGNNPLG